MKLSNLVQTLGDLLVSKGVDEYAAFLAASSIGMIMVVSLAIFVNWVAKRIILQIINKLVQHTPWDWDDIMRDQGVFTRLSHIAPAFVIQSMGPSVFGGGELATKIVHAAVMVYVLVVFLAVFSAIINSICFIINRSERGHQIPIKGFAQAIKLVIFLIGGILILSVLFGKTPVYFLSGIGALTAVLLLVFRDALLGLVAGVMISVNQLVRVGDWIELPKAGADGDVIDVSLTTVKVRNWDRTITTIPSYDLISQSFKNWRNMFEDGGRRIKRSLYLDMASVRFVDEKLLQRFMRIRRLRPYLEEKLAEVQKENNDPDLDMEILCNGRRLTNLGTFRAYCAAYLRENPLIHKNMTFLVRQLQPTEHGLPLEIYVFTTDTRWAFYEGIQADIFDHLLAVLSEFDLCVFQSPSGRDLRHLQDSLSHARIAQN